MLISTYSDSESMGECQLSPSGSAFSAILSAFVGSIVNGLTSGWLVAFMTGWISWLALFRALIGGLYMLYRCLTNSWGPGNHEQIPNSGYPMHDSNSELDAGEEARRALTQLSRFNLLRNIWPPATLVRAVGSAQQSRKKNPLASSQQDLNRDVSILGWVGWAYGALYAPVTQSLWIAANIKNSSNGGAKIVKGLTIAVTALPLGVDCRVRYADSLKRKWASVLFNLANSMSCILQSMYCAILLTDGAINLRSSGNFPMPVFGIYPLFSLFWMYGSFLILPMRDGGRKRAGQVHWAGYFLDIGVGAFAGIFLAAPAFGLYQSAQFDRTVSGESGDGMSDIKTYLGCETQLWKKFVAVVP
jgi:hypothetical protein